MRHLLVKKKSWFYSPWIAVALVIFVVWGMVSVVRAYLKQREAVTLRNESRQELAGLEQKQQELDKKITNLSTDQGMEAEVRERYRVVKPGEQLVIVVDNKDSVPTKSQSEGFWQKLRAFVGL
jgi:cell division protein FtsB